jgi:hypothetical protein
MANEISNGNGTAFGSGVVRIDFESKSCDCLASSRFFRHLNSRTHDSSAVASSTVGAWLAPLELPHVGLVAPRSIYQTSIPHILLSRKKRILDGGYRFPAEMAAGKRFAQSRQDCGRDDDPNSSVEHRARISLHVLATNPSNPKESIPGAELFVCMNHFR